MTASLPAKTRSSGYTANMEGVAAVDRGMSVVRALEEARSPLTLTEISNATELYKSAVLRLLVSLERCGLVMRRPDQRYGLGYFAFQLGKAYDAMTPLENVLLPLMERLVQQGMESPSFHVKRDATTRLCLLRLDSLHSTLDRVRVGDVLPLNAGAAGKVLLGVAGPTELREGTVCLQVSYGERDPACGAVAGPIYGPGKVLLGALSLSGPLDRFTSTSVAGMASVLRQACKTATLQLGGTWPEEPNGE